MPPIDLSKYIVSVFAAGIIFMAIKAIAQKIDSMSKSGAPNKHSESEPVIETIQAGIKSTATSRKVAKKTTLTKPVATTIHSKPRKKPSENKGFWPGPKFFIELSQYFGTICAAFVGLSISFMLSAEKAAYDKKAHLLVVLKRYQSDIEYYRTWFNPVNTVFRSNNPVDAKELFWKGVENHPYPYFGNYKDPALFEMTSTTAQLMQRQDYETKLLFDFDSASKPLAALSEIDSALSFSYGQITREMTFITDNDTASFLENTQGAVKVLNTFVHPL
jgi:hypothetical protein